MHKTAFAFSLLSALLLLSATDVPAQDEVYRWVDEDGVIHFDDQPGENKEAVKVVSQSGVGGNQTAAAAAPASEPSIAQQRRDERAEKRREAAEKNAATEKACEQARQRVAYLEPSPRVMVENEDGSVSRMDDEKRLELLEEAKAYIGKNCTS